MLALLLAVALRKPPTEDDSNSESALQLETILQREQQERQQWSLSQIARMRVQRAHHIRMRAISSDAYCTPLTEAQVAEAHKRHLRQAAARFTLIDIIWYLLLLALIFAMANLQTDPNKYSQGQSLRKLFLSNTPNKDSLPAIKVLYFYSLGLQNCFIIKY